MAKARVLVDIQGKPPRGYKRFVKVCAEQIIEKMELEFNCELSVLLTDDSLMRHLNYDYRQIDDTTDVLSFAMNEGTALALPPSKRYKLLGDVVISIDKAIKQAKEQGHSIKREMALLITHGVLHLLGYDDVTEEGLKEMVELGNKYVSMIEPDAIM